EPDLLHRLTRIGLRLPECRQERVPMLVDRQRMERELDGAAETCVHELKPLLIRGAEGAQRDAEGANGVPHANALDGRGRLDGIRLPEGDRGRSGGRGSARVQRPRLRILPNLVAPENAAAADHARNAAGRVRAAAESE